MKTFICNATKSIYVCIYVFIRCSCCCFISLSSLARLFSFLFSVRIVVYECVFVFAMIFFSLFTSRWLSSSPICFKKFIFLALLSVFGLKFHIWTHFFLFVLVFFLASYSQFSLCIRAIHPYIHRDKKKSQGSCRRLFTSVWKANETHAGWNVISINNRISMASIRWHTPIPLPLLVLSRTRAESKPKRIEFLFIWKIAATLCFCSY